MLTEICAWTWDDTSNSTNTDSNRIAMREQAEDHLSSCNFSSGPWKLELNVRLTLTCTSLVDWACAAVVYCSEASSLAPTLSLWISNLWIRPMWESCTFLILEMIEIPYMPVRTVVQYMDTRDMTVGLCMGILHWFKPWHSVSVIASFKFTRDMSSFYAISGWNDTFMCIAFCAFA